mmetsp:Transcript_54791/g.98698  ORF Transcript_54791/g.98698 Transcript_54791/m.98698 type:complete len:261 (+) Transcript_54791:1046-1828(+)
MKAAMTKAKTAYDGLFTRSATPPLTMVAPAVQNAHWKNQLRAREVLRPFKASTEPSPWVTKSPLANCLEPMNLSVSLPSSFKGPPYAKAQPNKYQPKVPTHTLTRFFMSTFWAFFTRQDPVSSRAKPACMIITRAPHSSSQAESIAPFMLSTSTSNSVFVTKLAPCCRLRAVAASEIWPSCTPTSSSMASSSARRASSSTSISFGDSAASTSDPAHKKTPAASSRAMKMVLVGRRTRPPSTSMVTRRLEPWLILLPGGRS